MQELYYTYSRSSLPYISLPMTEGNGITRFLDQLDPFEPPEPPGAAGCPRRQSTHPRAGPETVCGVPDIAGPRRSEWSPKEGNTVHADSTVVVVHLKV